MTNKLQRILVCPLDWGLGHASRCIPLIYAFLAEGHEVFLAGSGTSATLLKQTFPTLPFIPFESFTLRYSSGSSQVWAVLKALPHLFKRIQTERKELATIVKEHRITQVVSDNRFGCYCQDVKSIYITHQVCVKLPFPFGFLEPLVARWHRNIMEKYDECWIPDFQELERSLAGKLSHPKRIPANAQYIGPLSRFKTVVKHDVLDSDSVIGSASKMPKQFQGSTLTLAILSGVEPQRSIFEGYLLDSLQLELTDKVVLVQGLPQHGCTPYYVGKVEVYPSLDTTTLQALVQQASRIICRSGYSTVMDMHALGKLPACTFVPTPGQPEQEYLAAYLRTKNLG